MPLPTAGEIRKSIGGKFFHVTFVKRTTGESRVMLARMGVQKHLTPSPNRGPAYSPKDYNLLPVYDMQKAAYRSIPLDGIVEIRCGEFVVRA